MDEQAVWQAYENFMALLTHYLPNAASNIAATLAGISSADVPTVWQCW
jgi:hypothetical protein